VLGEPRAAHVRFERVCVSVCKHPRAGVRVKCGQEILQHDSEVANQHFSTEVSRGMQIYISGWSEPMCF